MTKAIIVPAYLIEELIRQLTKVNENLDRIADEIDALEARMRGEK